MKRLLVAAMLIASGVAAAEAREAAVPAAAGGYQCSHFVLPENLVPSDASFGKHLAAQYNNANGE
ncbi:hypothetical protein GXW71_07580 [Roseomonas hellenica]|uniref:Uncharacterized protein n=1 Tax=Plastoroseomonas hellenica TaxID=2687306 RepID=A0ABS5EV96_9PROT|nr:hypothetical protein [Plastoroseomonas hellenica]MBR0664214.1 hypothetical protein [Plastoroseomonas hellenica]